MLIYEKSYVYGLYGVFGQDIVFFLEFRESTANELECVGVFLIFLDVALKHSVVSFKDLVCFGSDLQDISVFFVKF